MLRSCILIAVLVLSCREKEVESLLVIDTQTSEPAEMKLSQLFENNGMIVLETNDSILISQITHICKSGDNFFILTTKGSEREILKFNINGNFLCRIGRIGNGPGEYNSLRDITIDSFNNRVLATTNKKVLIYKFDGSFDTDFTLEPNIIVQDIYLMDETIWLAFVQFKTYTQFRFLLYSYNLNGQKQDSIILGQFDTQNFMTIGYPNIISGNSTARFLYFPIVSQELPLRDTLYQWSNTQLVPSIKLDFTRISENNYQEIELQRNSRGEFQNVLNDLSIWEMYRADKYLFTRYHYKNWPYLLVYNFSEKTGNIISGFHDDIFIPKNNQLIMPLPIDLEKNEFYYTLSGIQLEGKIEGVNENSNPVIFLLRLKE